MTLQLRRDTAANWTSADPTLAAGQPGYETDTGRVKIGDGSTAWTSLAYRFESGSLPDGDKGDITVSGSGATWTIDSGAVTLAKMANIATDSFIGRDTAGTGVPEVLSASTARTILNVADGANNYSHPNHSGDVTSVGDGATTIAAGAVTLAKMADMATSSLIYRKTAGAGAPEVNTLATLKTDLGLTGTNSGDQTTIVGITGTKAQFDTAVTDGNFLYVGDVTSNATHTGDVTGATALTIAADAVTYAKMQNVSAASRLLGRGDSGSGDPQEITLGANLTMTGTTLAATGGGATNLTYTAATRVIASDTGTDATLPLVTSGDAGLAPASGGGTANFLRADGTWAAPPSGGAPTLITAAPGSDQANWNPAGFGSGVGYIKLQPTTNSWLTGIAAGATDQFLTLFNDSLFVVALETESSASTAANRFKKRGSFETVWILPAESVMIRYDATLSRWAVVAQSRNIYEIGQRDFFQGPNTTTSVQFGWQGASTTTATLSTTGPTGTPTNQFTEYNYVQVTNSTASGTSSVRSNQLGYMRGATTGRQGFFHTGNVRFTAMGATTGCVRAGMLASTAVSTTLNSALTNCLLIGAEVAQTTLWITHNDAAGASVQIDLGANFPVPSATAAYEYSFYAPSGSSFVRYMVRRLDSRFVAEGTLSADLPVNTTALGHRLEVMVGGTAVANTAQMAMLLTAGL